MTIKSRVAKLEQARPAESDGIKLVWHSTVRRDGKGLLFERPYHAVILRAPDAPNETLIRHESEGQAAFLARVLEAVRRDRAGANPAFEESVMWKPDPRSDQTE